MIRAASLIKQVARYLTDYDSTDAAYQHVEWSEQDLADYFRQAVFMVTAADPKAHTCRVELEIGGEQLVDLPEKCDTLLQVLGFMDASGKLYTNLKVNIEDEAPFTVARPTCAATRGVSPGFDLRIASTSNDTIIFDPAPPTGKLIMSCACVPDVLGETADVDMAVKYEPVVFWWMVSMAFGTDIEAAPMRERSDQYWSRGVDILKLLSPKATVPQRSS